MSRSLAVTLALLATLGCRGRLPVDDTDDVGEGERERDVVDDGEGKSEPAAVAPFSISPSLGRVAIRGAQVGRIGIVDDGTRIIVVPVSPTSAVGGVGPALPALDGDEVAVVRVDVNGDVIDVDVLDDGSDEPVDDVLVDAVIARDGQLCVLTANATSGLTLHRLDSTNDAAVVVADAAAPAFVAVDNGACIVSSTVPALGAARVARYGPEGEQWHVDTLPAAEAGPVAVDVDGSIVAVGDSSADEGIGGVDVDGVAFSGRGDTPALHSLVLTSRGALIEFKYSEHFVDPRRLIVTAHGPQLAGRCGGRACVTDLDGDATSLSSVGGGAFESIIETSEGTVAVGRATGAITAVDATIDGNLGSAGVSVQFDGENSIRTATWIPSSVSTSIVDAAVDVDGGVVSLVALSGVARRADGSEVYAPSVTIMIFGDGELSSPEARQTWQTVEARPPLELSVPGDPLALTSTTTGAELLYDRVIGDGVAEQGGQSSAITTQPDQFDVVSIAVDAGGSFLGADVVNTGDDRVDGFAYAKDGTRCLSIIHQTTSNRTLLRTRPDGSTERTSAMSEALGAGDGSCIVNDFDGEVWSLSVINDAGLQRVFQPQLRVSKAVIGSAGDLIAAAYTFDQGGTVETEAGTVDVAPNHSVLIRVGELTTVVDVDPTLREGEELRVDDVAELEDGSVIVTGLFYPVDWIKPVRRTIAVDPAGGRQWSRDIVDAFGMSPLGDGVMIFGRTRDDVEVATGVVVPGGPVGRETSFAITLNASGELRAVTWLLGLQVIGVTQRAGHTLWAFHDPTLGVEDVALVSGPRELHAGSIVIIDAAWLPTISFGRAIAPQ